MRHYTPQRFSRKAGCEQFPNGRRGALCAAQFLLAGTVRRRDGSRSAMLP